MGTEKAEQKRIGEDAAGSEPGSEIDRKYWAAMVLFAGLAVLVWFTMDAGKVLVFNRPVELRLVPLIIIGGLALRTVLARYAEKIRKDSQ
jgi:hypothetical protein